MRLDRKMAGKQNGSPREIQHVQAPIQINGPVLVGYRGVAI